MLGSTNEINYQWYWSMNFQITQFYLYWSSFTTDQAECLHTEMHRVRSKCIANRVWWNYTLHPIKTLQPIGFESVNHKNFRRIFCRIGYCVTVTPFCSTCVERNTWASKVETKSRSSAKTENTLIIDRLTQCCIGNPTFLQKSPRISICINFF